MFCTDEKLSLIGDFDSTQGRLLQIVYEKCNNQTIQPQGSCYSDEKITDFLRQRYIIVYQNQVRFQTSEYDSERIVPEGKIVWFPIESLQRSIVSHKVQVTNLQLQDQRHVHIGELSELDDTIFNIKSYIRRPYERLDRIHQILLYEFDHDL